ncbi:restriction endonuclease subunit S [Streptomyces somaliensis DSM 40738]|uniref:Restriction endonuclease subunit S n=1 Tax=Streptomyces somaliensis (strain ATCC 33201 / DSM 40738 / JCM 12659 / KCTC 9044 / NCTC 11332 / NRRL B-12077 / IP 733) TaxID=1134445 RepID=A0AA44IBT3_STRE0|nr:restriction endonuclease subunit S [Streptomyces somaliensis]MCQ0022808.1 restriction endonuclease subunit S [Streptomyces somaliensis DSM 40738]NKY12970.1 restriction endonuclease subunit S [Streptomyces somaliensis DSM 40738]
MSSDAEIRWVPVREVGEVRMGKQLSPSSREATGKFPYLRVANVLLGRIDYSDVNFMGFSSDERRIYGLKPGDILLNEGQSLELVGRSAIYEGAAGDYCFQNTLVRFRPGGEVLPAYAQIIFERWLATGVFAAVAKQTTSIAHLGGDRFGALLFPLRPLPEQRRIVEVIDAVAAQEGAIARSVAKLQKVGDGVASAQLGGVELGRFEDVIEYGPQNGIYKQASSYGVEGTPIVRIDSFKGGPSDFTRNLLRVSVTESEASSYGLAVGDIVINRVNTPELVGKSTAVRELTEPTIFESNMMRCKVRSDRAVPAFVEMWLGSVLPKKYFRVRAKSAISQASINGDDVRDCPFPCIEVREQRAILDRLAAVTVQQRLEEAELVKLRNMKQGLVDDLLSGRS